MRIESQKKVVLIYESDYICKVVEFCIEIFSDWKVTSATSGKEGLATIASVRPDVILLDIQMLRMDHFDILKDLRADLRLVNIPVVLLTNGIELAKPKNIAKFGVQGAIAKPLQPIKLIFQISEILGWGKIAIAW